MEAAARHYFSEWNTRNGSALVPLFAADGTLRDWDVRIGKMGRCVCVCVGFTRRRPPFPADQRVWRGRRGRGQWENFCRGARHLHRGAGRTRKRGDTNRGVRNPGTPRGRHRPKGG